MALIEHRLDGDIDKVKMAIERLKMFEPYALQLNPKGYYVCDSGGKDSGVVKALCVDAKVQFEIVHHHTTVDTPEIVYFVREEQRRFRSMGIDYTITQPEMTMWQLIPFKQFVPRRQERWCCEWLKEYGGEGRLMVQGVRWAESNRRANKSGVLHSDTKENGLCIFTNDNDDGKQMFENCTIRNHATLNIIIEWETEDVWEITRTKRIPYCVEYDNGAERLGCVGCPLTSDEVRQKEFQRWPAYKRLYIKAFSKMLEARKLAGKHGRIDTLTPEQIFEWYIGKLKMPKQIEGQTEMEI